VNILFICKRRPQQRDLITRPYGRFFHIPTLLARKGHKVTVVLIDFRGAPAEDLQRDGVNWIGLDARTMGSLRIYNVLKARTSQLGPDWVFGLSDAWTGVIAWRLAASFGAKLALDAYDNYESYMPWNLPLHFLWRHSLGKADLITAAGPQLAQLLGKHARPGVSAEIIPMSADPAFIPMDKSSCRESLELPQQAPLIGYYGSWAARRGTDSMLNIFDQVRSKIPEARLVLSGNPPEHIKNHPGIINLGYLDDQDLPVLVNAIDVACILTRNSRFGKYSYPAKLCEAVACETKVVATDTAPVRWMLGSSNSSLVPVDDPDAFSAKILDVLESKYDDIAPLPDWHQGAEKLERLLRN
jgi:glycosyltransferase involved in cell wall biosynthesis